LKAPAKTPRRKKNQKNFCPSADLNADARMSPPDGTKVGKVFCFFFSKKKTLAFLPPTYPPPQKQHQPDRPRPG
jgi:hypothetical protein